MTEDEYFNALHASWSGQLVVCALGSSATGWWNFSGSSEAFYMNAAMGHASSFGLGLALALPDELVWVLDSDGGTVMNVSSLITQASIQPTNFLRFIMNNHGYASLGGHPIVNGPDHDFVGLALSAGIDNVYAVRDESELRTITAEISENRRHAVIVVDVEPPERSTGLEGPLTIPFEGAEIKYRFGRAIEARTGVSVFGPSGV